MVEGFDAHRPSGAQPSDEGAARGGGPGGDHGIGTVGVVGAGLIGGSIVRACLAAGLEVVVADRDTATLDLAAAAGAKPVALDELRASAHVVFLSVPPTAVADLWAGWAGRPAGEGPRPVVLDVSSVKAPVLAGLEEHALPAAAPGGVLVLSHPMAGRESSGWSAGDQELFRAATWILSPPQALTGREFARCVDLIESIGARICCMDPTFHDRFAAVTSHVPHVLAFVFQRLVDDLDPVGWRRFSGNSLRDVLRISSSNPQLWTQILTGNAEHLAPLLRELATRIESFDPTTDVDAGQPRTLTEAPPGEPVHLQLPLDEVIGGGRPALLATGEQALHLTRWSVDPAAGALRLEFTPRLPSPT